MATAKSKTRRNSTSTSRKSSKRPSAKTAKAVSSRSGSKAKASSRSGQQPSAKQKGGKASKEGSLLQQYFLHALKDIYWAEEALTKALPKMAKEATSPKLKKAFEEHLAVTEKQIKRVEQVFKLMGEKAESKKCDAMNGLIEESESVISETKDDTSTRDAALIITAQKVEHYEIASYGGLVQLARTMGQKQIADLLQTTLDEEKETDVKLTKLAEQGGVNEKASDEKGDKGESSSIKEKVMSLFS